MDYKKYTKIKIFVFKIRLQKRFFTFIRPCFDFPAIFNRSKSFSTSLTKDMKRQDDPMKKLIVGTAEKIKQNDHGI